MQRPDPFNQAPAGRGVAIPRISARRVVIVGNGGSGKSHLARRLSASLGIPAVSLDSIFWLPGGFNEKRPSAQVDELIAGQRATSAWIVEGVFGDLAGRFVDLADLLIWLDLPWATCEAGLRERGSESAEQRDPVAADENFRKLVAWCSEYGTRTTASSHFGHKKLFDGFSGVKLRFDRRSDVDSFAKQSGPLVR
jgi:adenylate kinase family enzyme